MVVAFCVLLRPADITLLVYRGTGPRRLARRGLSGLGPRRPGVLSSAEVGGPGAVVPLLQTRSACSRRPPGRDRPLERRRAARWGSSVSVVGGAESGQAGDEPTPKSGGNRTATIR